MKTSRIILRWISRLLLAALSLVALAAFALFVAIPSQEAWSHARKLADALTNARSVSLVEFERDSFGPELVFARVSASHKQIAALRSATGAWFSPIPRKRAMCFYPHHRVEIVRADGSTLRFDVCFGCRNFAFGDQHAVTMPASWHESLSRLFTAAGMPLREDYSALAKSHPDYHLVEEARRQFEKAPDG